MAVGAIQVERKLFTVEQYEQMVSTGVLSEDERLELIEGDIVDMSPIGGLHIQVVNRLNRLLVKRLHDRAIVSIQNPIRLANSEPQPDVAILRPEVDSRPADVPRVGDVLLLIEVADSTVAYDRSIKVPLYASAGIPEVWLIDLQERVIEVYRGAAANRYKESHTLVGTDVATILAIPDFNSSADEIIGG